LYEGEDELEEEGEEDMGVSDRLMLLFLPLDLLFTFEDDDLDEIFVFESSFDLPL
jgi:hypothetical protein